MDHRKTVIALALVFAAALPLSGCGDNDNGNSNDNGGGGGTPTPVRTSTPGGATATPVGPTATAVQPTATEDGAPTPTATSTPTGAACGAGETVLVDLALDGAVTSARLDLGYPGSVNIPGSGTDQSVADSVAFTGNGLTIVNDFDQSGDLTDDTLTASLVGTAELDPGLFATVTFDCVEGEPKPDASNFTCTVVSASLGGAAVTPTCTVSIQ